MFTGKANLNVIANLGSKFKSGFPVMLSGLSGRFTQAMAKEKVQTGLDIGGHSIKLVELVTKSGACTLEKFAIAARPDSSPDSNGNLSEFIRNLMAEKEISAGPVNISISGPDVIVRYVFFPRMSAAELRGAIGFEAEKYIPFNINEVVLDCQILETDAADNRMRVLLVAAKKELIERQLEMLRKAGLEPGVVDVDSFALINSFLTSGVPLPKDTPVALVDIGEKLTGINILKNGVPFFTREVSIGGSNFTQKIAKKLRVETGEASELKHASSPEKSAELLNAEEEILNDLVREIRSSFHYFENESGKKVEKVFLCGGTARLKGLTTFLASNLEVEIEDWNPLNSMTLAAGINQQELEEVKELLPVAIGLARRG